MLGNAGQCWATLSNAKSNLRNTYYGFKATFLHMNGGQQQQTKKMPRRLRAGASVALNMQAFNLFYNHKPYSYHLGMLHQKIWSIYLFSLFKHYIPAIFEKVDQNFK